MLYCLIVVVLHLIWQCLFSASKICLIADSERLANDQGIPFVLLTPVLSVILCAGATEKSVLLLLLRRGHANLLCIVPILLYVWPLSEHVYSVHHTQLIFLLTSCKLGNEQWWTIFLQPRYWTSFLCSLWICHRTIAKVFLENFL